MLEILSNEEILKEYSLKDIIRYNHRPKLKEESVAEHTCFVQLFCMKIMAQLPNLSFCQRYRVMILAALHDTAECVTSDIPHDIKAEYPEVREALEKAENDYFHENWTYYQSEIDKADDLVYNIISLADAYSVVQFVRNEIRLGNVSNEMQLIRDEAELRVMLYTDKVRKEYEKIGGTENATEQQS